MKAWQFTNTHEPLVLVDVEEPEPGPGDVLIDVKAAGLCRSGVDMIEDEGWLQIEPSFWSSSGPFRTQP